MKNLRLNYKHSLIAMGLLLTSQFLSRQIEGYNRAKELTSGDNCIIANTNIAFYIDDKDNDLHIVRWNSKSNDGSYSFALEEILKNGEQVNPGLGILAGTQYCKR